MPTTSSSTSTSTSTSTTTPPPSLHHHLTNILHSTTTSLLSPFLQQQRQPKLTIPFQFVDASFPLPTKPTRYPFDSTPRDDSISSNSASVRNRLPSTESNSGFPSTVRIGGLNSNGGKGGGPAFVGQVFSMCDLSGTGLMAVSTHFDIPFISKRTPEWLKKMFASVIKSERNGPVFRFFMDLGDAVTYVKRLNIPSGVVGACRLDLAYEHFKEKPHLFQFVPNEKQVKAANQLLKMMAQSDGKKKVDGVPVFTAQNLDIAIATIDGIKWYTPYFFDKNMLDSILEESVDQHFHSLIQTRHMQRRRDVIDDNLAAEVIEEMGESLLEPPEVQEMLDEMGNPGIPLSVISKAAEIQLLYAVDRIILGNRWLRKATGIQPKFPYVVDSFQRRSASSLQKTSKSTDFLTNSEMEDHNHELHLQENTQIKHDQGRDLRLPFQDWFNNQWLKQSKPKKESDVRIDGSTEEHLKQLDSNRFLPKITMVGISTGDTGHMSKGSLKKTMEELTKELEQLDQGSTSNNPTDEFKTEDRDPLFVANVGDYYSGMSKTGSSRWVRSGIN